MILAGLAHVSESHLSRTAFLGMTEVLTLPHVSFPLAGGPRYVLTEVTGTRVCSHPLTRASHLAELRVRAGGTVPAGIGMQSYLPKECVGEG